MKCAGIDVASAGWSAIAIAVNGVPIRAFAWKPTDTHDSDAARIEAQFKWMRRCLTMVKPDVIAVEELAVFMNKTVIRSLARHEGVALLAAKQSGAVVIHPGIGQSRRVVFGAGNISKDDSWTAFRKKYPDLTLPAKTRGGLDQMDAYTHALAAPTLLERR